MPRPARNWRRILFCTGSALVVLGWAPLLVYEALAAITGDPSYSDNPVGLGCLTALLGWPGLLLLIIGISLDKPRQPPPA